MKKGIVIGCVDPRLHDVLPGVAEIIGVERVYVFRAAGPDGVWRDPSLVEEKLGTLAGVRRLAPLAEPEAIAFVGHTDCAGHCVSDEEHRQHILEAAEALKAELGTAQPVYAIIAERGSSDTDWNLEHLRTF